METDFGKTLTLRIPPNARCSRPVRHKLAAFVGGLGVDREETEEFIYVVGEALANAIEHSQTNDVIEVRCQVEDDKVLATITDCGVGFKNDPVASVRLPDALSEHGRGMPLMRRYADIFAIHSVPGRGTAVVVGHSLRNKRRTCAA